MEEASTMVGVGGWILLLVVAMTNFAQRSGLVCPLAQRWNTSITTPKGVDYLHLGLEKWLPRTQFPLGLS